MQDTIKNGKVVNFSYTLTNTEGAVLDQSEEFTYLHGYNNIIPGLEAALEGLTVGNEKKVTVPPASAYGEYEESLVQPVPRSMFPEGQSIEPDMVFESETEHGLMMFRVVEVRESEVVMDANHPLAGVTLTFDVKINGIREGSKEEMEHGHVHSGHNGH